MQRDRHLASGDLCRESTQPKSDCNLSRRIDVALPPASRGEAAPAPLSAMAIALPR